MKGLIKFQACIGFELMTSAVTVQRSTNWVNQLTGSWSLSWLVINPSSDEQTSVRESTKIIYLNIFAN